MLKVYSPIFIHAPLVTNTSVIIVKTNLIFSPASEKTELTKREVIPLLLSILAIGLGFRLK